MSTTPSKLIGVSFEAERTPIFSKGQPRPRVTRLYCFLKGECPYLKRGQCLENKILGEGCMFGRTSYDEGPSKRAKSYWEFCQKGKEEEAKGPRMPGTPYGNVMEVLDEYVYLPYAHMDMCKEVPFVQHSAFIVSGKPYLKLEDFTPQVVVTLAKFVPYAMMGGAIDTYQKESVALFLLHLKLKFPKLYEEAAELDSSIVQKTLDLTKVKKLKATMKMIPAGCAEGYTVGDRGLTPKSWDGEWLEAVGSRDAMGFFLTGFSAADNTFHLRFKPALESTEVVVRDPALLGRIVCKRPELLNRLGK